MRDTQRSSLGANRSVKVDKDNSMKVSIGGFTYELFIQVASKASKQ